MHLEFSDGLYGSLGEFRAASLGMRFGFDEGLPGKAWAAGHPVIVTTFEDSHFKRIAAARAAGLTCGVALPIFAGDFLLAVVVLFCARFMPATATATPSLLPTTATPGSASMTA